MHYKYFVNFHYYFLKTMQQWQWLIFLSSFHLLCVTEVRIRYKGNHKIHMTITMNLDYFLCAWCLNCFSSYLTKTSTNSCINWTEEPKRIIISASCCFLIRQLQYVVSHFLAQILSSAHALNIQYTNKQVKMCTQVLIFFRFGYFFLPVYVFMGVIYFLPCKF